VQAGVAGLGWLLIINISPQTQALLHEQAGRLGQEEDTLADALVLRALQASGEDYEATCQALVEGLADVEAGRTVSFEEARAQWEQQKASCLYRVHAA